MVVLGDLDGTAKARFKISMIDKKGIEIYNDCALYMPYIDKELQTNLGSIAWSIGTQNEWGYVNHDAVKMVLVVDLKRVGASSLYIEVEPPRYTKEEIVKELGQAIFDDVIHTDLNLYSAWAGIFKAAEDFHNGNKGDIDDRSEYCRIDMTDAEERKLQKFVDSLDLTKIKKACD